MSDGVTTPLELVLLPLSLQERGLGGEVFASPCRNF